MRWHRRLVLSLSKGRLRKPNPEQDVDQGLLERLAQLYAPTEGPDEMATRFEPALRERRAKQLNSEQRTSKMPRLSPRWGIAALGVLAAITAATLAIVMPNGRQSTPSAAEARAFLQQIPATMDIEKGQVLHYVIEGYVRHGPLADEIQARNDPTLPSEHHVQEIWTEIASPEAAVQTRSILRDASGNVLQDNRTNPSQVAAGVTVPINAPRDRAERLQMLLDAGKARAIAETPDSITIESRVPWINPFAEGRDTDDIAVPYEEDLAPVEVVQEVSIRADGLLLYSRTYVTTPSGEKVLTMSRETKVAEVLDSAPAGTFGGQGQ